MFKLALMSMVFSLVTSSSIAQGTLARNCLHGPGESATDRSRRQQAVDYATKVNMAETMYTIGPRQTTRSYRPLEELPNLPVLPAGFAVDFHYDERSYAFSLKDTRDMCHYAVFSDQDKLIYEAVAKTDTVGIIPLGTR